MFLSPSLTSKPSFRKHSYFDKLFDGDQPYQISSQEKQPAFSVAFPSSPSKKAKHNIYTCICFFFFITMVAYLGCNSLDPHANKASPASRHDATAAIETFGAMPALRGLGSVYRKGNKAMGDLVVAHVAENTSLQDLRLFLRTLHRSGVTSRADIVFLFPWNRLPSGMLDVIHEENAHFKNLMQKVSKEHMGPPGSMSNSSSSMPTLPSSSSSETLPSSSSMPLASCTSSNSSINPLNLNAYSGSGSEHEPSAQPLWGIRNLNTSQTNNTDEGSLSHQFGSMVGFSVSELNSDNALQGFINHPPLALRRWACYQMLLGMVRHRFKHILLTDASGVAILRDPFVAMGKKRAALYVSLEDRAWGASFSGDELGVRLGSLDIEVGIASESLIALQSGLNSSSLRRQLSSYGDGKGNIANAVANLDDGKKGDVPSTSRFSRTQRSHWRRASRQRIDTRRRSGTGRRRRARKASSPTGGLCERVYGRQMWSTLEENEKKKKLVNSAVIMGSIQQVRGLANTMVTEIVKVALERKNRDAFPDSVLLSYLIHRSTSVLGKRVVEHLHLMDNADSYVHSLIGSQQTSFFLKKTRAAYSVIHGNSKSKRWEIVMRAIRRDICASEGDAGVYSDCDSSI
ncbi:hypothetical protein GOP47_0025142 [Adiantum capillus-veneris]|uniref:DUF7780 domain-containing protein n=1 Tax=Adiantum capillus-veneris TaxID=13818 RepID=A0A9D4U3H5_ADICA|nr:hypothetical protein GOP47_0025142 [Adiantum capillus-veneris]